MAGAAWVRESKRVTMIADGLRIARFYQPPHVASARSGVRAASRAARIVATNAADAQVIEPAEEGRLGQGRSAERRAGEVAPDAPVEVVAVQTRPRLGAPAALRPTLDHEVSGEVELRTIDEDLGARRAEVHPEVVPRALAVCGGGADIGLTAPGKPGATR